MTCNNNVLNVYFSYLVSTNSDSLVLYANVNTDFDVYSFRVNDNSVGVYCTKFVGYDYNDGDFVTTHVADVWDDDFLSVVKALS